jgi:hypothetical protein
MTPRAVNSGVTLSDWNVSPVPLAKSDQRIALPPAFGTIFIARPLVSVSPSAPVVVNVTSSACPTSKL